jgi:uncharacterized repeat protein (TIGR03803 family)
MAYPSQSRSWTSGPQLRVASAALALAIMPVILPVQAAQAQTYTVLHKFTGGADGAYPESALMRDRKGILYGTTYDGGTADFGTVFKLNRADRQTVLHSFSDTGGDGGCPYFGALLRDAAGNLYGTTYGGGDAGFGIIFKLDPSGRETVLHSFAGTPDGAYPYAGLVRDAVGDFYGTTSGGGSGACTDGCGTVFKLDAFGKETVRYSFNGDAEGSYPEAGLVQDSAGAFYGTTSGGGSYACNSYWGCGTVYKLDKSGKLITLHTFTGGKDGAIPYADLVRDQAGNLYGTTNQGGGSGVGTVFKLDNKGNETVLHRFIGRPDGALPVAGLIRDAAGNLYGVTSKGGSGAGTVFKLDIKGNETVLYRFTGGVDGRDPEASLVRDAAGNLYGTTTSGGAGHGVVFKLIP